MDHLSVLKTSGLSTKEIAQKLSLGERTIQLYLRGHRDIPKSTRKLIEYEFGDGVVNDPGETYSTANQHINQLKETIKLKDQIISGLERNIELLEGQNEILKFQLDQSRKNGT